MRNAKKQEFKNDDEPLSLDMSFDEALEMLLNTPLPVETDDEDMHREERNQEDWE